MSEFRIYKFAMEKTYLKRLLIFEILIVVAVPFIFKWIEPKKIAALFAGGLFVLLGFSVLNASFRFQNLRKTFFTLIGGVHLFVISIPMLSARIYFFGTDFEQIQIFGLRAPDFHKASEWVYMGLLLATLFQLIKSVRNQGNKKAT